jgi:hypothetical protein
MERIDKNSHISEEDVLAQDGGTCEIDYKDFKMVVSLREVTECVQRWAKSDRNENISVIASVNRCLDENYKIIMDWSMNNLPMDDQIMSDFAADVILWYSHEIFRGRQSLVKIVE